MTEAHLTILTLHMVCFVFRMVCSPLDSLRLFAHIAIAKLCVLKSLLLMSADMILKVSMICESKHIRADASVVSSST